MALQMLKIKRLKKKKVEFCCIYVYLRNLRPNCKTNILSLSYREMVLFWRKATGFKSISDSLHGLWF